MITLNPYAIASAAVLHVVLGLAWYSKSGFGRLWMTLVGKKEKDLERTKEYTLPLLSIELIAGILIAVVLSFMASLFVRTWLGGVMIGFLAWAGFILTASLHEFLWEGRRSTLFFLRNSYHLLSLLLMGIIISSWV